MKYDRTKVENGEFRKGIICFFKGHIWEWWIEVKDGERLVWKQCIRCGVMYNNRAPSDQKYFRKGDPKPFTLGTCQCGKRVPIIDYGYSICGQGDWGRHRFCFLCGKDLGSVRWY